MTNAPPRSDRRFAFRSTASLLVLAGVAGSAGGCSILGLAANAVTRPIIKAAYPGLAGQTVGVMVSADRGTRIDFPRLQLDLAEGVVRGIKIAQGRQAAELNGTTVPPGATPKEIFLYQKNNPTYDLDPITTVATKFPVTRLIYVEVESFSLNPADVLELFRGELRARVRVLETANGVSRVAFDDKVTAIYPDDMATAGSPNLDRGKTYVGTRDAFVTQLLKRFVSYEE